MPVDHWDRSRICNGHLVRLNADKLAILLMELVNRHISSAQPAFVEVPEVGELRQEGARYILDLEIPQVGQYEVEHWQCQ